MTHNGDTGDVACDHYNRFKDDVALMRKLGLKAYRFSISWSRVLPEGKGRVNQAGLDFYSRLVDELLENDIAPLATLFHWDLPAALDDRGGWLNPDIADWFADYGKLMYRALDGRVKRWVTLNEPWVVTDGGYLHGALAPGHRSRFEAPIATHQPAARARRRGAGLSRRRQARDRPGGEPRAEVLRPRNRSRTPRPSSARDAYMNRQYLDPVFLGSYPEELQEIFGDAWPEWPQADYDLIKTKFDFLGVNYYTRSVTHANNSYPLRAGAVRQPLGTYTETGWEVFPQGLTDTLTWVKERYGDIPMYITENGAAFFDPPVAENDRVRDPLRIDYLQKHIGAVKTAIDAGCDIRGYMVWSLLDNLEWSLGYSKRFGIVHVNYGTQQRTPKDSARWYSNVIATHGASLAIRFRVESLFRAGGRRRSFLVAARYRLGKNERRRPPPISEAICSAEAESMALQILLTY